jgi:hypothetical protein
MSLAGDLRPDIIAFLPGSISGSIGALRGEKLDVENASPALKIIVI